MRDHRCLVRATTWNAFHGGPTHASERATDPSSEARSQSDIYRLAYAVNRVTPYSAACARHDRTMISTSRHGLAAIAAVLAVTASETAAVERPAVSRESRSHSVSIPGCTVVVASRRPLVLADGQVVHLGTQSTARQGRAILLAGVPSFTWPAGATPGSAPQTRDSLIGVLITDDGRIQGVPNPLLGRTLSFAKVTSAGRGAWHVVMSERLTTREGHELATDSARLWYGRYDGRAWSDVASIAVVHGSYTATEYTSDLVVDEARTLALAYPLSAQVASTAMTGVVLMRRGDRGWSADTLRVAMEPRYTRLVTGPRPGEWTVLYVAQFFDNERLINASLHAAVWNGRWGLPLVVGRAGERAVVNPRAFPVRAGLLLTWSRRAERTDSGTAPRIEWMLTGPDAARAPLRRAVAIIGSNDYAAIALGPNAVMWFARDGLTGDRIRVAAFTGDTVADFGTLRIRNETWLAAVVFPGDGVGLITSEVGKQPTEPPAASILTVVKPACPTG